MDVGKTATAAPEELVIAGLDNDIDSSHELYDERAFIQPEDDFIKNVMVLGILNPVKVRRIDSALFVVDGRQRVKAAREANRRFTELGLPDRIRVPVTDYGTVGADRTNIVSQIISSNSFRKDDDILTKIRKAHRLFTINGGDWDSTGIACGVSPATLKNWFKLAEADDMVHSALKQDKITLSASYYLSSHFPPHQQREVLITLLKRAGSIRITDELVKNYHKELIGAKTYDPDSGVLNTQEDEEELDNSAKGKMDAGGAFADGFDPDSDDPMPDNEDDEKPTRVSGGKTRTSTGISKLFLRRALNTEFAKNMDAEQRGVLYWLANGFNEDSKMVGWWNMFHVGVTKELKEKRSKRKKKENANEEDE